MSSQPLQQNTPPASEQHEPADFRLISFSPAPHLRLVDNLTLGLVNAVYSDLERVGALLKELAQNGDKARFRELFSEHIKNILPKVANGGMCFVTQDPRDGEKMALHLALSLHPVLHDEPLEVQQAIVGELLKANNILMPFSMLNEDCARRAQLFLLGHEHAQIEMRKNGELSGRAEEAWHKINKDLENSSGNPDLALCAEVRDKITAGRPKIDGVDFFLYATDSHSPFRPHLRKIAVQDGNLNGILPLPYFCASLAALYAGYVADNDPVALQSHHAFSQEIDNLRVQADCAALNDLAKLQELGLVGPSKFLALAGRGPVFAHARRLGFKPRCSHIPEILHLPSQLLTERCSA